MEKLLKDSLGCNNNATLNLHTIVTTSIADAIQHGILDVIRDSEKFFIPDFVPQDKALLTILRSLTCTFTATEQGANALLINHTQDIIPPPPTLQPPLPPLIIAAQNARGMGISTETSPTTSVRDATAGARDIPSPIALW